MVQTRSRIDNMIKVKEEIIDNPNTFLYHGVEYDSYQKMVEAKRKRNMEMLQNSGLLDIATEIRSSNVQAKITRGLKRKVEKVKNVQLSKRRSNRLAGVKASNIYVESDSKGVFKTSTDVHTIVQKEKKSPSVFYHNRINDGSDLSVSEAVKLSGTKWVKENSIEEAKEFMKSSKSWMQIGSQTPNESRNDVVPSTFQEQSQAKVTPDRIYAITSHPSEHSIIVSAGDKSGHIGIWNVNQKDIVENGADGVYLFKPHKGAVSQLEWNKGGSSMFSFSYDGTVREFDSHRCNFRQIFATYDDSQKFKDKCGYGLDQGYNYWLQYGCLDPRNDKCMFFSTSLGSIIHVDLRAGNNSPLTSGGCVTINVDLCDKKINTVSLHPNGHTLATGGRDNVVQLWDIRTMGSKTKNSKHFAAQTYSRSINSAFFSPSGNTLVATSMDDHITLTSDAHIMKGKMKHTKRIYHNNQTGRWLSTFMTQWHPTTKKDIFTIGCLKQPRRIEIFDGNSGALDKTLSGDAITAVSSRCCFHPTENRMVVMGGNSSGRVVVASDTW